MLRFTLAASAALQLADVVTTALGQSAGVAEGNPLIRHELAVHGVGLWAVMKFADWAVLVALAVLASTLAPAALPVIRVAVRVTNVALAFVVLSNVGVLVRA